MSRGGARTEAEGPERKCIVTGERQPKAGLVRFVVGPDGAIVPDVAGKLPGRGIYVSAERSALETAARGKLFQRAARRPVTVPEGLAGLVEGLVLRRVIDSLSPSVIIADGNNYHSYVRRWQATENKRKLPFHHTGANGAFRTAFLRRSRRGTYPCHHPPADL